ncbi:hypothetical protein PoB_007084700 [Plakobranchus ocellatus]|uniref:Ion transport domain-containing protein n=1 Tax=Plakobranchus ocellatus TaxID=259542 RepID=A0AAV4DJ94_9GAST|nr:hypothetical protein PoB_007084700 [Plakobranchus ocellatus]
MSGGRDGRDLPWGSPVKVAVAPDTLKSSRHSSLKDLVSSSGSQDDGFCSNSENIGRGFLNSKNGGVPMVRRSSDENRAEAPVAPNTGVTGSARQHNRVPEPDVEDRGPGQSSTSLPLPGDSPCIGQLSASHTDGGKVPDMRNTDNLSTSATFTNPVTAIVSSPSGSQPPSHCLPPPPPRLPPGASTVGSNPPPSRACPARDNALAYPSQPEHQKGGDSPSQNFVLSKPTSLLPSSNSSSFASPTKSLSSKSYLPLTVSQGLRSSFESLPLEIEKQQRQEEHRDCLDDQANEIPVVKTVSTQPRLGPQLSFAGNSYNSNSNNNENEESNKRRGCSTSEFASRVFDSSGSSTESLKCDKNGDTKCSKNLNNTQVLYPSLNSAHNSLTGRNSNACETLSDLNKRYPFRNSCSESGAADSNGNSNVIAKKGELLSSSDNSDRGLGSHGLEVLTPVHSISCSPGEVRRLGREPTFEDRDHIPLDFVYKESEQDKPRSFGNDNTCKDGSKVVNRVCDSPSVVKSSKSVNSGLDREEGGGKNKNVFRFLLDGQSLDLSCEDEDSFGGTGRRGKRAGIGEDGATVRRSYSSPNSLLSERPDGEKCSLNDKKAFSVFLGSEADSTFAEENAQVSTAADDSVVFPASKRFSAGQSSIVTVVTSDSEDKVAKKDKKKKKRLWKKKSKNESTAPDKDASSILSLTLPGRESKRSSKGSGGSGGGGGGGGRRFFRRKENKDSENAGAQADEDGDGDVGSRPPSVASSAKGPRRLARRGIGMFPSSNWRRLRNTLKAANEMQAPKKPKHTLTREDSFLRKFSTRNHHQNVHNSANSTDDDSRWGGSGGGGGGSGGGSGGVATYTSEGGIRRIPGRRFVIQHDGNFMFYWLGMVTVSVLYNLWTCIARQAFREIQQSCSECWFAFDALFDTIYILDIIIQFRTGYLDQGLMVYDSRKLRDRYTHSRIVYVDFLCLLPLDFLQLFIGIHPMIRFPRFLKVYRSFRFIHMLESRTAYPNLIRVANLTHILFLGAHWFAAFYYMISEAENFEGEWAYPKPVGEFADVTRKYLRSLFWSTLTLTTIGDLPPPDNSEQ